MADRTDIDALLISALYGELTPADEARLTAHLESHPADRTALAELTQTRATVRESRILAVQLEPPQSVSAMLLREAARRAPREREEAGWFHRFVRSFMAHPAMAAAAMLVLVVGVAGTLYVRHGELYVGPVASERADSAAAPTSAMPPVSAPRPAAAHEAAPTGTVAPEPSAPPAPVDLAVRDQNAAAGSGSFGVGLADDEKLADKRDAIAQGDTVALHRGEAGDVTGGETKELSGRLRASAPPAPPARPSPMLTKPSKKGSGGVELRTRELAPKDFDDESQDRAKLEVDRGEDGRGPAIAKNAKADRAPGYVVGPSGGGATPAPVTVPVLPAPDPSARQPSYDAPAPPPATTSIERGTKSKAPAPAKTVARSSVAQSPKAAPPQPAPAADDPSAEAAAVAQSEKRPPATKPSRVDPKSEEQSVQDKLFAWAAQQHRQVIALVGSNKCREAADAAVAIYNRAPGYYASNVVTDRSIKPCLAYVTRERDREDRTRLAAKRAMSVDTPAAAAPTPPANASPPPPPARK